ncbi:MAG: hypothetical protein U9O20_01215 [Patescibacteria group bacterium]|nr:hypothetical protein [Patescibacteria group bacterium]
MQFQKQKKYKKIIAAFLLVTFLMFSGGQARAGYWSENFKANTVDTMYDEILYGIKKVILQKMKQSAGKSVSGKMRSLAAGTTGKSGVVSNYEDFIFGASQRDVDNYVTDFFRVMQTGGVSPETRGELRMIEIAIRNELEPSMPDDLFEHRINSPTPRKDVFDQTVGGGKEEYLEMQMGGAHPVDIFFQTENMISARFEQEAVANEAEAVAGGGFATVINGNKVVPGSVMKDLVSASEEMPIQMINNAGSWQEIIATMAVQSLVSFSKQGIEIVSKPAKNKERRIQRSRTNGVNGALDQVYSGINY